MRFAESSLEGLRSLSKPVIEIMGTDSDLNQDVAPRSCQTSAEVYRFIVLIVF